MMEVEKLRMEHVEARYHSPMREDQMGESWLALRREMLRSRWARDHGLSPEEVGIAVHPRTGKVYFQWAQALKFLPAQKPAPESTG